jgi:hypothetical protein
MTHERFAFAVSSDGIDVHLVGTDHEIDVDQAVVDALRAEFFLGQRRAFARAKRRPRPSAIWQAAFSSNRVLKNNRPDCEMGELYGTSATSPREAAPSS